MKWHRSLTRKSFLFFISAISLGFCWGLLFGHRIPHSFGYCSNKTFFARSDWNDPAASFPRNHNYHEGSAAVQVFFLPSAANTPRMALKVLLDLLSHAQRSICGAFYDLELEPVAATLIQKHRSGVQVQLVSDSDYAHRTGIRQCMEAGIPVLFDQRSALMHNKFCVVDKTWVWTGSANITSNCMFRNNNNVLLITSVELAQNFTHEFEEMFHLQQFGAGSPPRTPYPVLTISGITIETFFAPEDQAGKAIIHRIRESSEGINFMAFVFTSVPIAEAMAERLSSGVSVRGVLERRNAGSPHSRRNFLEKHGAQIFLDNNPHTMHHKVIIIDTHTVITGSYNFTAAAETRNDENLLIIHSSGIARLFLDEMERVLN